jgi:hypothetical protein
MGGVVRSVASTVTGKSTKKSRGGEKKTEAEPRKIVSRRGTRSRQSRVGRSMIGGTLPGGNNAVANLGTSTRNPRGKTNLGT